MTLQEQCAHFLSKYLLDDVSSLAEEELTQYLRRLAGREGSYWVGLGWTPSEINEELVKQVQAL